MAETGGGKNLLVGCHAHCSVTSTRPVRESPLTAPVSRPHGARRVRAGRGCTGAADWATPSRNPLGPTQVGPKVSGPRDTREGAGRRPRAAPAQHSDGAGVPESGSRNCAGAACPALKGGVSLRGAQAGQRPGRDRAWGSASGRPSRRTRRRVRAARPAGWLGGGGPRPVWLLSHFALPGYRAGPRHHEDLDFGARL